MPTGNVTAPPARPGMADQLMPRAALPSDLPAIAAFHNAAYADRRTPEQFAWEYRGCRPASSILTVMTDGDRIVGTQGMIPIVLNVGGEHVLTGKSENTLTDSAYRGRRVMARLYAFALERCREKGLRCIWGYTGTAPAVALLRRLSFQVHDGAMQTASAVLSGWRAAGGELHARRALARRVAGAAYVLAGALRFRLGRRPRPARRAFDVRRELPPAAQRDALLARLRMRYPSLIHIEQDDAYVRWRLLDNPFGRYRFYAAYDEGQLRAYCYCNLPDPTAAYLTDIAFETADAGACLLADLLADLEREQVAVVHFLGSSRNPLMQEVFATLARFGFLRRRAGTSFVLFIPPGTDLPSGTGVENWYLSGLWTDGSTY